ncbi:MAG: hypothetical protein ACHQQQ_08150 [Bacteroidota bacterium]
MKTIFDLLTIDIKSLPDANCTEVGKITNSSGDLITEYTLVLDKPELGLFKMASIKQFLSGSKNIGLYNYNIASIKIPALEKLINTLYSFYGKDSNTTPLGLFTSYDQHAIEKLISNPNDGFWMGRDWNLGDQAISINLDDEKLELFIHGVPPS